MVPYVDEAAVSKLYKAAHKHHQKSSLNKGNLINSLPIRLTNELPAGMTMTSKAKQAQLSTFVRDNLTSDVPQIEKPFIRSTSSNVITTEVEEIEESNYFLYGFFNNG